MHILTNKLVHLWRLFWHVNVSQLAFRAKAKTKQKWRLWIKQTSTNNVVWKSISKKVMFSLLSCCKPLWHNNAIYGMGLQLQEVDTNCHAYTKGMAVFHLEELKGGLPVLQNWLQWFFFQPAVHKKCLNWYDLVIQSERK